MSVVHNSPKARILSYLYERYLESDGKTLSPIGAIASQHGISSRAAGEHLAKEYLIAEYRHDANDFYCRISRQGLRYVAPAYLDNKVNELLMDISIRGGHTDVMEALGLEAGQYHVALDIAEEMEERGWATRQEIRNGAERSVVIEPTVQGIEEARRRNNGGWL